MSSYERTRGSDAGSRAPFEPWPAVEVHVEWGEQGARLAADRGDLVVIIDVLSFSTSMTTVVTNGATAFSYSEAEIDALGGRNELCRHLGADIVTKDRAAADGGYSLSPASLATIQPGHRLILTSWNGALCVAAATQAPAILLGCLINRQAVAGAVSHHLDGGIGRRCTLVASAEHWASAANTAGLRPSFEDQLGAGAIAAVLASAGHSLSEEAGACVSIYAAVEHRIVDALLGCVSGRELVARGYRDDVVIAAAVDTTDAVPRWTSASADREFRR